MPTGDLHLVVDIGAWWTTAVYESGTGVQPVLFDGQTRLPSGVFRDPDTGALVPGPSGLAAGMTQPDRYYPDPMTLLRYAGTRHFVDAFDSGAAVSAVLAHVATLVSGQTGTAVSTLTIVTAQAWGHRARQRLHQAATSAGLPEPHIVTAAAAAAASVAADLPSTGGHGPFIAVCIAGEALPEMTVFDAGSAYQQLATAPVCDPTVSPIDEALIRVAAERATPGGDAAAIAADWRVAWEVRRARAALAVQPRASLLPPEPYPAVVITRDDLTAASAPHLGRFDDTVKQLLADADLDPSHIAAVVLVGEAATLTGLQAQLARSGLPSPVVLQNPHAVANGAALLTRPLDAARSSVTAATVRLPRTRLTVGSLTGIATLAACSVALLLQTIATADTWSIGGRITDVRVPVENLGLAAALAALTAWAAAQLAPTTWLISAHADDDTATGVLLRRGYFTAAALGVVLAGLWGLGTGVGVGYPSETYLRAALTSAAPIAACAALIALAAPRIPAPALPDWLHRARPPVIPVALAALGVNLQRAAGTLTFPVDLIGTPGVAQTIGAALLGIATAITATRHLIIRVITAIILGIGYGLVSSVSTVRYLTIAYIVVLVWWAITTTAVTMTTTANRVKAWLRQRRSAGSS